MTPTRSRGFFFVLEGLDRSGKTTQIDKLLQYLTNKNRTVYETHFPARETQTGQMLDSYLRNRTDTSDEAAHLLFSANRWEKAQQIRDRAEQRGEWIICSRYAYSGVAYTCAKGKKTLDWCKGPDRGLPAPDIVIYLKIDPEKAALRSAYGEERYEKTEFQKKVREVFERMFAEDSRVVEVDAMQDVETVHECIVKAVEERWREIEARGETKLEALWEE